MLYARLADLVVVLHFSFVLFVLLGGLLALRWRWVPWLHLPAALWGAAVELGGWICPLTALENRLRHLGGAAGYAGGFVERYLLPILYPAGLTHGIQLVLATVVLIANMIVYAWVWRRIRRERRHAG